MHSLYVARSYRGQYVLCHFVFRLHKRTQFSFALLYGTLKAQVTSYHALQVNKALNNNKFMITILQAGKANEGNIFKENLNRPSLTSCHRISEFQLNRKIKAAKFPV